MDFSPTSNINCTCKLSNKYEGLFNNLVNRIFRSQIVDSFGFLRCMCRVTFTYTIIDYINLNTFITKYLHRGPFESITGYSLLSTLIFVILLVLIEFHLRTKG